MLQKPHTEVFKAFRTFLSMLEAMKISRILSRNVFSVSKVQNMHFNSVLVSTYIKLGRKLKQYFMWLYEKKGFMD